MKPVSKYAYFKGTLYFTIQHTGLGIITYWTSTRVIIWIYVDIFRYATNSSICFELKLLPIDTHFQSLEISTKEFLLNAKITNDIFFHFANDITVTHLRGAWWKAQAAVEQTTVFYLVNVVWCVESEPVSDHPYIQIQAKTKRHLINYVWSLNMHSILYKYDDIALFSVNVDQTAVFYWLTSTILHFSAWSTVDAHRRWFLLRF